MNLGKMEVIVGGKAGLFMSLSIDNYIIMLKGRLGEPIPKMHPSLQFQRKILVTYVEVCDSLRKDHPLSSEERQDIQDCVVRWERLQATMNAHKRPDGYRLWAEGEAQREAGNPTARVFTSNDLYCIQEALAEYLAACRLVEKRADFTEDEGAELGNDIPLYEYGYEAVMKARRCLWEEVRIGQAPPD